MELSIFYEHVAEASTQSNISIPEVLKICKASGIDYVEMDGARLINDFDNIMGMLSEADIKISGIYKTFDYCHKIQRRASRDFVKMAKKAKAKSILVVPGFDDELSEDVFKKTIRNLNYISSYVKKSGDGLMVALEDFDNEKSPCFNEERLLRLFNNTKDIYMAFDTGNFYIAGEDCLSTYHSFEKIIRHVHLKDRGPEACAVGDGIIDIKEIVNRLKNIGYDGILALEHFGAADQLAAIQKSAEYVRGLL